MLVGTRLINICMISLVKNKWLYVGLILLAGGCLLSLFGGTTSVKSLALFRAFFFRSEADPTTVLILYRIRIPRLLAGLACGSAFALSGLLLQEALRNPLSSPGIMGIHNGAGLFALFSALVFGPWPFARGCMAFVGALCSMALVTLIGHFAGGGRSVLLLAGVSVSSLMSAGINLLITLRPESVSDKTAFQLGSLHGVQPRMLLMASLMILPGIGVAFGLSRGISLFALGDEAAHGLGLPVRRYRMMTIFASAFLSAAAVSVCGLVGFVGLIVPNLIRRLTQADMPGRMVLCLLFGSGLLVFCDVLARSLAYPYELPVGMLLSVLGAPFFIFLLIRRREGGL